MNVDQLSAVKNMIPNWIVHNDDKGTKTGTHPVKITRKMTPPEEGPFPTKVILVDFDTMVIVGEQG